MFFCILLIINMQQSQGVNDRTFGGHIVYWILDQGENFRDTVFSIMIGRSEMQKTMGAVCVLAISGWACAQPTTWDGDAGDGFWITDSNWDTDSAPSGSSQVMIPSDAGEVNIILSAESCASLSCLSSLRLTSATLSVSGTGAVSNMIFDGGGFIPTVETDGAFTISGNSTCITGDARGNGGEFSNAGVFDAFSFGIDGANGFSGVNTGTWNIPLSSGALTLSNGAVFDNQGTFTVQPSAVITGSSGLFSNSGTLSRVGGVGSTTIDTGLTQLSGTTSASGATAVISVLSDGWQLVGGTLEVSNGGKLSLAGSNLARTRTLGVSAITGDGTVDLFPSNATIDWINSTTTNVSTGGVVAYSGTLNLDGDLTNNGLFVGRGVSFSGTGSFNNSTIGTLEVPTGNGLEFKMDAETTGAVELRGTMFLSDGAVLDQKFHVSNGGFQLYNDSLVTTLTGGMSGVLKSSGKIELKGDASGIVSSSISTRLETQGGNSIYAYNGTLVLGGGGSISNSVIRLKGDLSAAALRFEGSLPWTVDGSTAIFQTAGPNSTEVSFGVINTAGPGITLGSGVELSVEENVTVNLLSSEFSGAGELINNGRLKWIGGAVGCRVNNLKTMDILPGIIGKTLKAELQNGFLDGFVLQSSTFTVDGGSIINNGDWQMSGSSSINPAVAGGEMHNHGQLTVIDPGAGAHTIGIDLNNTGTVIALQGHLFLTGDVLQLNQLDGTLSGGNWAANPGSSITFSRSLVRLRGPARLLGGSSEVPDLPSLESIDNGGAARLFNTEFNGSMNLSEGSEMTAAGDVTVNGDYTSTGGSKTIIEPDAKVEATGSMSVGEVDSAADEINVIAVLARHRGAPTPSIVTSTLDLWGRLGVGESGSSVISMQGDLLMHPSARMHVSMIQSGPSVNTVDLLNVTGSAVLDGTLVIDASMSEFSVGEERTVLIASNGISGMFDEVQAIGLGAGEGFVASVVGNEVRITSGIVCIADFTGDGLLDFFDVSAFLGAFTAQSQIADLNNDGMFNFFDVSAFLGAFGAGCP
jgi:hypothetical protein